MDGLVVEGNVCRFGKRFGRQVKHQGTWWGEMVEFYIAVDFVLAVMTGLTKAKCRSRLDFYLYFIGERHWLDLTNQLKREPVRQMSES